MKRIMGLILALTLVFTLAATFMGCTETPAAPPTTTPTETRVPHIEAAENFILNSPTFKYDGIGGSLAMIEAEEDAAAGEIIFTFNFQTAHPGHGDRSGQILAQVITNHTVVILVDTDKDVVSAATCDGTWDMLAQKDIPITVSGNVISGGDTTPEGLQDAPRQYVYRIEQDDHTFINVGYTAYPPSPAGDAARAKITLEFHNGEVQPGDYLEVRGTYNQDTDTVYVSNQGDYFKTYLRKP